MGKTRLAFLFLLHIILLNYADSKLTVLQATNLNQIRTLYQRHVTIVAPTCIHIVITALRRLLLLLHAIIPCRLAFIYTFTAIVFLALLTLSLAFFSLLYTW